MERPLLAVSILVWALQWSLVRCCSYNETAGGCVGECASGACLPASCPPPSFPCCACPALGTQAQSSSNANDFQTSVTNMLNGMIKKDASGVYKGGKGVLVRAMNDGLNFKVVPATFITNDIITPSTVYPDGNPMCPNKGNSGYSSLSSCSDDPFARAQVVAVIGSQMGKFFSNFDQIQSDSWGYGIFYGTDANSADQRCFYSTDYNGYDCPGGWIPMGGSYSPESDKKGAGNFGPGNPAGGGQGGGSGCHYNQYNPGIDQYDAGDPNLVSTYACECNYNDLKGNWWQDWVNQWINSGTPKGAYEWMGWFKNGLAPSFGMDFAMCWVNNPRDMIQMQNAMWWFKDRWNNRMVPESPKYNEGDPQSQRRYWGWNEVPVDKSVVETTANWDAVLIKLPAAACGGDGKNDGPHCLSSSAGQHLEALFDWYISNNYLKVGRPNIGNRPGSYVVWLKEYFLGKQTWERQFFCDNWNHQKYQVVYDPISNQDKSGACFLDYNSQPPPAPSPVPPPQPPPSPGPAPGPIAGGVIRYASQNSKCLDIPGGSLNNGNKLEIWDCNNVAANQNWYYHKNSIRAGANTDKCIDFGGVNHGDPLEIQDCKRGKDSQKVSYDSKKQRYQLGKDANGNDHCIDLNSGSTRNGNKVQVWFCSDSNSQKWSGPPTMLYANTTQTEDEWTLHI